MFDENVEKKKDEYEKKWIKLFFSKNYQIVQHDKIQLKLPLFQPFN